MSQQGRPKSSQVELSFAESFGLSGAAAIVSKTGAAPLERVKLLIQNQDEMLKSGRLDKPYRGAGDCIARTFKTEGFLSFWQGNLANCIRYFPTQALNFAFKDKVKAMFNQSKDDTHAMQLTKNVLSGGVAGLMSLGFVYSLDYARTRLANDAKAGTGSRQYSGLVDVYRQTFKTDGIVGLYRGFVISGVGIFVYRGWYFGLYDTVKPIMLGADAGLASSFALGYAVTVASEMIAYPIDTVRRRMMMTSGEAIKYKGSMDCAMQIWRKEGGLSFFKGGWANILRGVAGAGVLAGFDGFKDIYLRLRGITGAP